MNKSIVGQSVFFLATCRVFANGVEDSKGKAPLLLDPISGTSPRGLNVISGTIAESNGFIAGKCYAVKATEDDVYVKEDGTKVRSFNFSVIGEIDAMEAMKQAMANSPKYLIQPKAKAEYVEEVEEVEAEVDLEA